MQYGEGGAVKMRMAAKTWSERLDPLQCRCGAISKDGGETDLHKQQQDSSVPEDWLGSVCQQQRHTSSVGQGRADKWGLTEQAGIDMGEANAVPTFTSSLPSSVVPYPAISVQSHPVCHCPLFQTRGVFTSTAPHSARDAAFVLSPFWGLLCFIFAWSQANPFLPSKKSKSEKESMLLLYTFCKAFQHQFLHTDIWIHTVLLITHFALWFILNRVAWWPQCSAPS